MATGAPNNERGLVVRGMLRSVAEVREHLEDDRWRLVDCRFSLEDPGLGEREYLRGHLPGAVYAHLDWHLSGRAIPGRTGRHPLPDPERLAITLGLWGIDESTQVVAYNGAGGAMAAARLWWLLRWLGHQAVALLDGGWPAWVEAGLPVEHGPVIQEPRTFAARRNDDLFVDAAFVAAVHHHPDYRLIDVRSRERFRGENETIDPVAGHIPGAISLPYLESLTPAGYFRQPAELRTHFGAVLGDTPPERTIVYCGSGVTAAHTVLAMAYAGLGMPRLYAGSWSEWITDPSRPVATGE